MNLPDMIAAVSAYRNGPGAKPAASSTPWVSDRPFSIEDILAAAQRTEPSEDRVLLPGQLLTAEEHEVLMREVAAEEINLARIELEMKEKYLASRREMVSDGVLMQAKANSALASGNPAIRDRARLELDTAKLLIGSGQAGMKEAEAAVTAAQLQLQATIAQMTAPLDEVAAKGKANEAA